MVVKFVVYSPCLCMKSPITLKFNDKINFYLTVSNNRVVLPIVEEQTNNKIEDLCKYRCVLQAVIFYAF